MVHGSAIERMRFAHMRQLSLDAEILVVARDRPEWCLEDSRLAREELVVARRFRFGDAERVSHEIARDERECRMQRIHERAEAPSAVHICRRHMRVGGMNKGELPRSRNW